MRAGLTVGATIQMNPLRCLSVVLRGVMGLLGLISASRASAQETPVFEGTSIPVPPAQSEPWAVPPSHLPPDAVRAITDLFTAGFADPRGCEYREIELRRPTGFGRKPEDEALPAHGWVLPAQAGDAPGYAVYWDGLVYPLLSVGAPADLHADVAKIFNEQPRPDQTLVKIPLLLRLGEIDPAEKVWQWWADEQKKAARIGAEAKDFDPFANLATVWLRAAHERVLRPHLHSRPKLALAYLKLLPDFRAAAEKAAEQRGIAVAQTPVLYRPPGPPILDLTFLDQVPALLSDEERRVRENVTNRDEEFAPDIIADKKQRVALLIRDLEDVEAYSMLSKGYLDFGRTEVVEALIRQGEDAVDPLLDCLEHDQRLTRSVHILRVIGVEEPAVAALRGILQTDEQFAYLDVPRGSGIRKLDRAALVAQIREYWNKFRDKTLPQRWYAILADDTADARAWAEVASDIVLPENEEIPVAGRFRFMIPPKPGEAVQLRGESLRGEAHPSVSHLLIQRLRETLARPRTNHMFFPLEPPQKLAAALAKWDGRNQLETLRWYGGELQKIIALQKENEGPSQIDNLVKTYLARAEFGDAGALGEYARWIRTADAGKLGKLAHSYGATFFAPVWSFPEDPAIVELTKWLFADPHSPWLLGASSNDPAWVAASLRLPLISVPSYRALILEELKSQRVVGKVERTAPDEIMVTYRYGNSEHNDDPEAPPVGFKADIRQGDFIASKVSKIRGAPAFKLYWPVERRDRAIELIAAFLRQYGDQLSHGSAADEDLSFFDVAALHFSPLDHPATREEVAAGRAIFSLEGQGERRVWKLPQYPVSASWIALKDYPSLERRNDPVTGQPTVTTHFDQTGNLWQAEEVLVDGKWQRFFGFVGRHRLAAVPAEEMNFGSPGFSEKLDDWEITLDVAGSRDPHGIIRPAAVRAGEPIPIAISIFNLRGVDREFPKAASIPRSMSADELGLEIHLAYSPRPAMRAFIYPPGPELKWVPVTPVAQAPPVDLPAAAGLLTPMRVTPLVGFDLAKRFDLTAPGTYRLVLKFKKGGLFDYEAAIPAEYLEVTRK